MSAAPAPTPDQARRDAIEILNGNAFRPKSEPRPLRGVLSWIGDAFAWIGNKLSPLGRPFVWVWQHTFGLLSGLFAWVVIIAVIVAVVVFIARHFQQRAVARDLLHPAPFDPFREGDDTRTIEQLESEAAAAERDGDYALAVRLRFRAGLLRLERDADAIVLRPGLTTREVRSTLVSTRFDDLANTFEMITYGEHPAPASAASDAEQQWPVVVREASK